MPYQVFMIENYVLRYHRGDEKPWIIFHYRDKGQPTSADRAVEPPFLTDCRFIQRTDQRQSPN